ncbi:transposable element Tcb2 transposase [Trichonephila clavipes]|nr:transposable element Tcb2 transposase [Trichonephila clavipes]
MLFCYSHGNGVFLQDNCTSYKSRLATGRLDEYSSHFSVTNWSPRSLDLNPIEYLWDVLKQDVKGHHTAATKLTELCTALANIWQVIPVELFQKLVEYMPCRVAAIIKAKGGPTRYKVGSTHQQIKTQLRYIFTLNRENFNDYILNKTGNDKQQQRLFTFLHVEGKQTKKSDYTRFWLLYRQWLLRNSSSDWIEWAGQGF